MEPETRLDESVGKAMDCDDLALIPYLPYILQDFYELGSSPRELAKLAQAYVPWLSAGSGSSQGPVSAPAARPTPLRVLDWTLAVRQGCRIHPPGQGTGLQLPGHRRHP